MEKTRSHPPVGPVINNWSPPPFPQRTEISGTYCRLEPLELDRHATSLFHAYQVDGSEIDWTYLPYGPFGRLEEFEAWLRTCAASQDPLFFTIVDSGTGQPAGMASYLRITPAHGCIEIGHIHYSRQLQKTRAATESQFLLMQHAFQLGYRRYEWKCDALNEPSRQAALRLGFTYEGTFRQAAVVKGRNRDTAWYSVIDADWPRLRSAYLRWLDDSNFDAAGQQRAPLGTLLTDSGSP